MGTFHITCPCGKEAVKKGSENFLFSARGLENGHIAVGQKLTGGKRRA